MYRNRVALIIGVTLGSVFYFYLAFMLENGTKYTQYGKLIYNYYFLSLLDGQLDIPAQIIGPEGHYDGIGRAFPYHGLAPIITRFVAYPFIDLTKISISTHTIYFFSVASAAIYTKFFLNGLNTNSSSDQRPNYFLVTMLYAGVWIASPTAMLVVNDSVYHEPIVMAYFFTGSFLLLVSTIDVNELPKMRLLLIIALCAGATVFARPHIAVGLYFGNVLLLGYLLLHHKSKVIIPVLCSFAILLVCGLALLGINMLRFGDPTRMHGALHQDTLEMGFVFFGFQPYDTPRNLAFAEHGRFNISRILPNFMLYFWDLPNIHITNSLNSFRVSLHEIYGVLTSNLGFIRNEIPTVGIFYLWMPWCATAILGVAFIRKMNAIKYVMLTTTLIILLMISSYGTLTLRYRAELWPFIAVLVWIILSSVNWSRNGAIMNKIALGLVFSITLIISSVVGFVILNHYSTYFRSHDHYGIWSYDYCAEIVSKKIELGPNRVDRICVLKDG
ncbi:hypothetical protein [Paramylibacter ulvae]|uniref:hypothetical protein n=1 Tax=Paramylibacter ulvae TaxID=1651968 RepID=UPI001673D5DE|nr:hypothetical protein [Amylibacter ulvae]